MIPRQLFIPTALLLLVAAGMSFYLWRLRTREVQRPQPSVVPQHVAPPSAGPVEQVTVWVAYDNPGRLGTQSISIPVSSGRQQRAEELLRGLLQLYAEKNSPHPLPAGAEIHNVFLVERGMAIVDVNAAFVDGQISGVLAEELTIASIVQTLAANIPGITRVKFLVEGKERESLAGHADISAFYDVEQVSGLAKQLSSQ
ncbi:MAG TPA: GerMN domain-containing protein [Terriglobales bacterium]